MAKDVIEKILEHEKNAESALASAEAQAKKILSDAEKQAENILAEARQEATEAVNRKASDADKRSVDLTREFAAKADAEIAKIKASAATKEDEALKALTELILK